MSAARSESPGWRLDAAVTDTDDIPTLASVDVTEASRVLCWPHTDRGSGGDAVIALLDSRGGGVRPVTLQDGTSEHVAFDDGDCPPRAG